MSGRWLRSSAGDAYVKGLQNAVAKGRAAAEDPTIRERDCPYSRFEHRKSWLDGFRAVRSAQPAPAVRPEPMW